MTPIEELKERIAELAQWEEIGILEPEEADELANCRRSLAEQELDAQRDRPISLARLNDFEADQRSIWRGLDIVARGVAAARGEEIGSGAAFQSYERAIADDWAIKTYPKGTPVIQVTYRIPRRYEPEYHIITFPESYLDGGWEEQERERLAIKNKKEADAKAKREAEVEARRRAEYDRLHAIYGESK